MTELRLSTDVWAFLRAFGGRWFILMSGPPTVPLAVLALFVGNAALRILFAVLAVVCGAFSSYWVWREERTVRNVAQARLAPRLEFVIEDCCRQQASLGRVGVANPSAVSIENARVYITIPRRQLDDRVVAWAGVAADVSWDIQPGPRSRHEHTAPFLVVGDSGQFFVQTTLSSTSSATAS